MFQDVGRFNWDATGEINLVMAKGLYRLGDSLIVL
jgi:hypothetical protein